MFGNISIVMGCVQVYSHVSVHMSLIFVNFKGLWGDVSEEYLNNDEV